ncbi:MAG: LysM peptidoglycan-binding domain-containing protein [Anaerolineaceae bacterium]|nr:LysM peptidoglycan-binding domain-containing protein [Anaerolineaceae bacterium]
MEQHGELEPFVRTESVSISPPRVNAYSNYPCGWSNFEGLDEDGKLASQNPTTRTAARKTHVVQQGDRMDYLAYQEYGQPGLWREIASANDLDDPLDIQPGQILIIPRLS